ncbi:hypothetical protein [Desulfonatronum sp. SC1]|uniref:hypothetical protein n=1 Tax=Desulfonatronum sp. SC1 TaxID=2109626 RepID=UPI000D31ECF0|nr:hypothetical protein [Desulfonatronum sp. SC1]PTN33299.1 hypothetical protein C6366_14665 [Desulfonatronum sp. SC1]
MDKSSVIGSLNESITELHKKVDDQGRILAKLTILQASIDIDGQSCYLCDYHREKHLEGAIREAILVLEQSKRSFRSKQLETLRKRLMEALLDADSEALDNAPCPTTFPSPRS